MKVPVDTAAKAFAELARGFCVWAESPSPDGSLYVAAAWVAKLHAAALLLPEVECESDGGLPDVPPSALEAARRVIGPFFGMYYREFFDPDPTLNDESVMGDVGDDLLDTYMDVKRGLLVFDEGQSVDALWHWSFLHRIHWGRHAVGAMFGIHCLWTAKLKDLDRR